MPAKPSVQTEDDNATVDRAMQQDAQWAETMDGESFSVPVLSLIQQSGVLSANNPGKAGWWVMNGFEPVQNPIIVPFMFGHSRRWAEQTGEGMETHCYSPIGAGYGIGRTEQGMPYSGMFCVDCPMSQFSEGHPAPCMRQLNFLTIVSDMGMPGRVIFQSTGYKVGGMMAGICKARKLGSTAFRLSAELKTDKNRAWYEPRYTVVLRPDDDVRAAIDFAMQSRPSVVPQVQQGEAAPF